METIVPFDLHRLFLGDTPPLFSLEIGFRIVVIYLFTLFMMQLMGKRGRGQMNSLELLLIIALGSATGDVMFYPEVPLVDAMLVIALVVSISRLLAWLEQEHPWVRSLFESEPTYLVLDGRVLTENLRRERVSPAELRSMLRECGVENLGEVRAALLELSGRMSVFRYADGAARPGESLLPAIPGSVAREERGDEALARG